MKKQGGSFALLLVLFVFVLGGLLWSSFRTKNLNIKTDLAALENLSLKEIDRLSFYLDQAASLAAQQALEKLAATGAVEGAKCFVHSFDGKKFIEWNEQCKPEQKLLKENFLIYYNQSLTELLNRYPEKFELKYDSSLEAGVLKTVAKTKILATQKAIFALYNISFDFEHTSEVNLTKLLSVDDFELIYQKVKNKKLEEIKKLNFEHWNFEVKESAGLIFFEFRTKKNFFFEKDGIEHYSPLELRFCHKL